MVGAQRQAPCQVESAAVRVLIGCERSGVIRRAFRERGHDAFSCDLEPAEDGSPFHYRADVLEVVKAEWCDLFIVHPECRYLSVSGMHWNHRRPERAAASKEALAFAHRCFEAFREVPRACLENPVSILSTAFRKPDQTVQPYDFGEDASKRTCFWLKNLPPLKATKRVPGRIVQWNGKSVERWSNQTDSGQNRLGPSEQRSMDRARTYPGIADAMAEQWGVLNERAGAL